MEKAMGVSAVWCSCWKALELSAGFVYEASRKLLLMILRLCFSEASWDAMSSSSDPNDRDVAEEDDEEPVAIEVD